MIRKTRVKRVRRTKSRKRNKNKMINRMKKLRRQVQTKMKTKKLRKSSQMRHHRLKKRSLSHLLQFIARIVLYHLNFVAITKRQIQNHVKSGCKRSTLIFMMRFTHLPQGKRPKKVKKQRKMENLLRKRRRLDLPLKMMSRKLSESINSSAVATRLSVKFMALSYLEAIIKILQKFLERNVPVVLPLLRWQGKNVFRFKVMLRVVFMTQQNKNQHH